MVAALSPADINYDETLSTLRCVPRGLEVGRSGPSRSLHGGPAPLGPSRLPVAGRAPRTSRASSRVPPLVALSGPRPPKLGRESSALG